MGLFAVTVIGQDRPGIVAALTRVLVSRQCNLEDTEMTILHGQFAMILIVTAPEDATSADLEEALAAGTAGLDLSVTAGAIPSAAAEAEQPGGELWSVTLYGTDRPGIVAEIAGLLAGEGVNIMSMETRVIGETDQPVYAMFLDVQLPVGGSGPEVAQRLGDKATELGIACTMRPDEPEIL
jgi:glycine cleavage system transcriptional repressor